MTLAETAEIAKGEKRFVNSRQEKLWKLNLWFISAGAAISARIFRKSG
jgi:hypothetical protein